MRWAGLLLIATLVGCGRIRFDGVARDSDSSGVDAYVPAFRKPITITSPVGSTLIDFAVSIVDPADTDLAAHAAADGSDLAFLDGEGTPLGSEVVRYTPAIGALEAWVRVPALPNGPTTIFLAYGSPPPARPAMWVDPYAVVYHMGFDARDELPDAAHGRDAAQAGATTRPAPATGIVGAAAVYDGVDDQMTAMNSTDLNFGLGSFSYEIWVNVMVSANNSDIALWKGGSSLGNPGYDYELGTNFWNAGFSDGTMSSLFQLGVETSLLGAWHQLVTVVDRVAGNIVGYVDGAQVDMMTLTFGSFDSPYSLDLGHNSGFPFKGVLDEVRVYSQALTADWIAATHTNYALPASMIAIGAEQ